MLKRLSKSRRHSADDVALSLSSPTNLEEPPGASNAALLRSSRVKYSRRSCTDSSSVQSLLSQQDHEDNVIQPSDYQMVTAMPAFIVEHEPDKQRGSSFGIWSKRMSKKIDSFRRSGSRETICSVPERIDTANGLNKAVNSDRNASNNNNNNNNNNNANAKTVEPKIDGKLEKRLQNASYRSPSPFKSFFIRMGSTGMLNSSKSNRRSQNIDDRLKTSDKENLFRSCSTSQLNTSPTYVKGDDPSEGIDLQISSRKDKTVSCDDLAGHRDDDVFDNPSRNVSPSISAVANGFIPCDFAGSRNETSMKKSNSCDFKESKKSSFPYAFLRSKLSVLPEERHGTFAPKDERLFKTASEEHFPTLKIEDSYNVTTTLGRRRTRNASRSHETTKTRNSHNESRTNTSRCEQAGYSLKSTHLQSIEDQFQQEDNGCYMPYDSSPMSLRASNVHHQVLSNRDTMDYTGRATDFRFGETSSLSMDLEAMANLRIQRRRNSAPSAEQRLSSHYVSSNESGYDSDGPRGESAGASETEGLSLKCTDSSDTSSIIDSEIEKPIRSSTPSECQDRSNSAVLGTRDSLSDNASELGHRGRTPSFEGKNDRIDGLRWHQSNSGRMLPSIHQTAFDETPAFILAKQNDFSRNVNSPISIERNNLGNLTDMGFHRTRLQENKARFLSDIIQPPKRLRRCRLVQLHKKDPNENLGIRLAQQCAGELRYIIVQLESDGIAQRDGRLRLGDEIVEVEGKELRTLESLEEVQEFLKSFTGNKVRLMTAYEETVPLLYANPATLPGEQEYLENAKNLSNMSLNDNPTKRALSNDESPADNELGSQQQLPIAGQPSKRPDFLPLSCRSTKKDAVAENSVESATDLQHYVTKHVAKFEKGYGKPSLGFSVVGGRDSPRGEMGIFVRRVFPGGQADFSKLLFQGDEILSLNGKMLRGHTHQEVIELFKAVREGPVELEIARRHSRYPRIALKSAPC